MSLRIGSQPKSNPSSQPKRQPEAARPRSGNSVRVVADGFDTPRRAPVEIGGAAGGTGAGYNGLNLSRSEVFQATDAAAAQYDLPPEVMRAIALQESGATQWTASGSPVRNDNTNGTTDWGVMQLNTQGWLGSGLDVNRAKSDERYNIQQGAHELRVASDHWFTQKYGHPFSMGWYNSLSPAQQKEARIDLFRSYNGWLPDTSNATPYENKIESGQTGKVSASTPKSTGPQRPTATPSSPSVPSAQLQYDGGVTYDPQVEQLQNALVKAGYLKQSDMDTGPGYYGPLTRAAVAQLQADHGIQGDDGVDYGPQTRAALTQALSRSGGAKSPAPSKPSSSSGTPSSDGSLQRWNVPYINQMSSAGAADDWNASANCGPTTLAMIAKGLGYGKSMVDGDLVNHFDQVAGVGSDGVGYDGIATMAKSAGFSADVKGTPSADWVKQQLAQGKLVAANGDRGVTLANEHPPYASGSLTGGHWIAVVGVAKDRNFLVQDPSTTCKELSPTELERFFRAHGDGGWAVAIGNGKPGNVGSGTSSSSPKSSTPGSAPSPSSQVSVPTAQLQYDGGTTYNPQVEQLQHALVQAGYLTQSDMDTGPGYYGPKTKAAVAQLQADAGITGDDGVDYGPQTRAALTQVLAKGSGSQNPQSAAPKSAPKPSGKSEPARYDGRTPAPGTTNTDGWIPTQPPETGSPSDRSPSKYDNVINQFAVGNNPRYTPRDGNTFCNIFLWDVTRAMGAEIPHWVDASGRPTSVGNGRELDANDTALWLEQHGAEYGWHKATPQEAQDAANAGKPAVFAWNNPGDIGHVGVVRPGAFDPELGPEIAQAGAENTNDTHVGNIFTSSSHGGGGYEAPTYWVHD